MGAIDNASRLAFHRAQMKKLPALCALIFLSSITAPYAEVEQPVSTTMTREAESNFSRGAKEFQNVTGAFFFFDTTQNNRPAIDFAVDSLRLGIMLNDPWQAGPLSGNFELLGESLAEGSLMVRATS